MPRTANRIVSDARRATRFPVDFSTTCEHAGGTEATVRMTNISAHGCQLVHDEPMAKGDRVGVRMPVIGRIEAFLVWSHNGRSGFEFERVIRATDFIALLDKLPGGDPPPLH